MGSIEADDERQITVLLTTGNFRGWHTVVRQVLQCLVLETSVERQNNLMLDPLHNVQAVQLSVQ